MGLIDSLRKAQQQAKHAAHHGVDTMKEEWEDTERRLRQKMRLHPAPVVNPASASAAGVAPAEEPERRTAIVSIHGEDVKETELPAIHPEKKTA